MKAVPKTHHFFWPYLQSRQDFPIPETIAYQVVCQSPYSLCFMRSVCVHMTSTINAARCPVTCVQHQAGHWEQPINEISIFPVHGEQKENLAMFIYSRTVSVIFHGIQVIIVSELIKYKWIFSTQIVTILYKAPNAMTTSDYSVILLLLVVAYGRGEPIPFRSLKLSNAKPG